MNRFGIAVLLGAWSGAAVAQDPGYFDMGLEQLLQVDIGLTGSRLQRDAAGSISALRVYRRDEIDASFAATIGEFLARLPANGSVLNAYGSSGTAHGTASVNLRNLGENRVLVLVNGRRMVNGTATRGFRDFVDLNAVPLAAIDRIEVLQDGASAVYGADAIAGVVNLITHAAVDGVRADARAAATAAGDGEQQQASLLGGAHGSDWGAWGGAAWVRQQPVFVDDRAFAATPQGALATNPPQGRYVIPGLGVLTRRDGASGDAPADFRAFDAASDGFNPFAGTYLRYPSTQASVFAEAWFDAGQVRWFGELLLTRRESEQNFSAADPRVLGSEGFRMPADHPFNPFDVDLAGSGFLVNRTLTPLGRRVNEQRVDTLRAVAGAQGRWLDGWRWEVAAGHAENRGEFFAHNQLHRDRLALSIGPVAACAAVPGCVPVPLFGDDAAFDAAVLDWLRVDGRDRNDVRQQTLNASTRGELASLPAGALQVAAGVEYRRERGVDRPDPVISGTAQQITGAPTTGQVRDGTSAAYRVGEAFVEFDAPLAARDGRTLLQANAALRYSDYDTIGGKQTGRLGLRYAPTPAWTLRANWTQGFRAPSILELFEGSRITNLPAQDPCSGQPQLPGCRGVPAGYRQSGTTVRATVGGNPDLDAETAYQYSVGASWQPHADWRISIDAYRVRIDDVILQFNTQQVLDDCAFSERRCELIERDAATGDIALLTVRRGNAGRRDVAGADVELDGRWRDWSLRVQGGYLDRFEDRQTIGASADTTSLAGTQLLRTSHPRWRALAGIAWRRGDWRVDYAWRYVHHMTEASATPEIPAVDCHDLQLSRRLEGGWRVRAGVQNLFDRDPPRSLVNANINFDIATYDPRGRVVYVGLEWTRQ